MPPLTNAKRLGELHVVAALREDFGHLLLSFYAGGDLSFAHFKVLWKAENLSNIHHSKSEKIGYKAFLQLVYEAVLFLLRNDLMDDIEVTSSTPALQLITESATRRRVWNVGVVYCLYTIYNTQLRSHQEPNFAPVNVGPETAALLSTAVQQLSTLAEFGRTAVAMYQTMLKAGTFLHCAYTGPTSLYYCQKVAKKATTQITDTINSLIESHNHLTTTSSRSSSSSANARQSRVVPVTDAAAVHMIRQVYSMRTSGHFQPPANAAEGSAVVMEVTNTATTAASNVEVDKETRVAELAAAMNGKEPAVVEPPPPVVDVTEYLTQSIAGRRQMRADKVKQRQLQQEELEAARVQRLRARVLKRLEKHDVVNQAVPAPVVEKDKTANRRGPRRTHAMRLQEEAAQQDAAQVETSGGPSHNTRRGSAPPRVSQLLETSPDSARASRRTRASSKELPDKASEPRLVPTGRHVAEINASRDAYLQENDNLMEGFEEFVGLRPKTTRPTASSTTSGGNSRSVVSRGVRSTRRTQVEEEPEVHLDAATGDIMEILRQLEQDSKRVLDRGGFSRALRSNTTTAPPAASVVRAARAPRAGPSAAAKTAPAPRQASVSRSVRSSETPSTGFGGLELREVSKKRKAAVLAPINNARTSTRRLAGIQGEEEEAPVAEDDIMGMLQRLERESDRILNGGAETVDENNESNGSEGSDAEGGVRAKLGPVSRRNSNRAERTQKGTALQTVPKPRAALKRRVASSGTSSTAPAQTSSPPAKRARAQRVTVLRAAEPEPVEEPLSAESGDIMALLRRLEQESDQILGGDAPVIISGSTRAGRNAVASGRTAATEARTKKRGPVPPPARSSPVQPSRASPSISEESPSPPVAKAPRKAPTKAAGKAKVSTKTSAARKKVDATPPVQQDSRRSNVPVSADSPAAVRTEEVADSGGMDIMDMLRQLEDESNGILSAQK